MLTMDFVVANRFQKARTAPDAELEPTRIACRAPRILLAEDDLEMRTILASALRADGYEVVEVGDGIALLHRLLYSRLLFGNGSGFDLVVSDVRMPELSGLGVLASMQSDDDAPPVILITAFGDQHCYAEAERLGARRCIDKPFDLHDFRVVVRGALTA